MIISIFFNILSGIAQLHLSIEEIVRHVAIPILGIEYWY
jgi:hypothetical protein